MQKDMTIYLCGHQKILLVSKLSNFIQISGFVGWYNSSIFTIAKHYFSNKDATESLCRACVEPVPVYFTRARKDGKVGLRVTRRIVSSYELDEAEIEKRSGSRSQTRVRRESVLGRETRNGKGKWGLRVTRGGRNGLSVPRGSKFGLQTTKSDSDHSDNVPKFWNKKNGWFL